MNLQKLKEELKTANLHPIHLEGSPLDEDYKEKIFIGDIEEYIETAHVLGVSAVYISTEVLDEERFQFETDDDEAEGIDLCRLNPKLKVYKEHIGKVCIFKLSIPVTDANISFYINEDWWLEFIELWAEVIHRIKNDKESAHAQFHAQQEKQDRKLLKMFGDLIRDENFVRLPTQRSMIEYAKEKIPGLEAVDAFILKREMQDLHAKIKAKGLGK